MRISDGELARKKERPRRDWEKCKILARVARWRVEWSEKVGKEFRSGS